MRLFLLGGRLVSLSAILAAAAAAQQCLPATSARITAATLAQADPRFGSLPASQIIGFAPEPGAKRVFATAELERIARRSSLPTENLREICVEVPLRPLTESDLIEAMRGELPARAELVIVEAPKGLQPVGKLTFLRAGLEPPVQDGSQLWRGQIQYAESRKTAIQAKVRVTQKLSAVLAKRDLPANSAISADSLEVAMVSLPITKDEPASTIEQVAGKIVRQSVKAGAVIHASYIDAPASVKRGDAVKVEVQSGSTKLVFEAVAERQGRDGELIELRNPSTGKLFRAKLTGTKAFIRL